MKIENCIHKYLLNEATSKELDFLSTWILEPGNERLFDAYVQMHFEIVAAMNQPDTKKIKDKLLRKMKRDRNRRRLTAFTKYAAVLSIVLAVGYLYQDDFLQSTTTDRLIPKEEPITIRLENGTVKELVPTKKMKLLNADGTPIGTQDHTRIIYEKKENVDKLVYNTLEVPYGKTFDVILADGTHVYLNAGTTLRYPTAFMKGGDRIVHLQGEAFFDVAKDEDHPFVVNANGINVKVLGTKFNVANYSENPNINTVLVEGSVALYMSKEMTGESSKPLTLKPGHKAEWDRDSNQIEVQSVDTSLYTSWIHGKLVFRNTTFREIRKTLERKYNVTIKNSNEDLDSQPYDATFDIESIEEVLESFNKSYSIEYTIMDNEVLIQ